jgi:hypothetical protein
MDIGVSMKRNLQRWGVILTCIVGIAGCTQKSGSSFKPNSEPDGFAGIKWGTEFSGANSDMVELRSITNPAEPNVKIKIYYSKKTDHLKMGEAQLDKIEYVFWKGKFAEVRISATGPENFNHLKKALFENYGTVDKTSQGTYPWHGNVTQIDLRYDEVAKTSSLSVASTKISNQELREMVESD